MIVVEDVWEVMVEGEASGYRTVPVRVPARSKDEARSRAEGYSRCEMVVEPVNLSAMGFPSVEVNEP